MDMGFVHSTHGRAIADTVLASSCGQGSSPRRHAFAYASQLEPCKQGPQRRVALQIMMPFRPPRYSEVAPGRVGQTYARHASSTSSVTGRLSEPRSRRGSGMAMYFSTSKTTPSQIVLLWCVVDCQRCAPEVTDSVRTTGQGTCSNNI
jgi:hypothetical protein